METTYTRKPPQPVHYDAEDADDLYVTRMPSSTRRYKAPDTADDPMVQNGTLIQRRRSSQISSSMVSNAVGVVNTQPLSHSHGRRHVTMIALLIGMVLKVVLLISFNAMHSWWQVYQDDIHYGNPRTSHLEAVVGHGDSISNPSEFIFTNLHGHIQIIEIPGGDASRIRDFSGPTLFGNGADLAVPTGTLRNDDGHYDLILHVQDQQIVYVNDGTTFHLQ